MQKISPVDLLRYIRCRGQGRMKLHFRGTDLESPFCISPIFGLQT